MYKSSSKSPELKEEFEDQDEVGLKPFPAGIYRALILFALVGAGGLICSTTDSTRHAGRSHIRRSPEKEAQAYMSHRARLHPKATGPVTRKRVKNLTDYAMCLKDKLGYPSSTDIHSFISRVGEGEPDKFSYHQNTDTYVIDKFFDDTTGTIMKQKTNANTEDTLAWLTFHPQDFLNEPLDCVKNKEDACFKTWDGNECLLLRPLAEAVGEANKEMFQTENEQMDFIVCTRTDFQQVLAWSSGLGLPLGYHAGKECPISGTYPGRVHPGNNHHGMGLGLDLANQKKAVKYLAKIGVACSPTSYFVVEEGHCALGDKYMLGELIKASKL